MNKAIFIGNLTRDPQLRSVNTPSGAASVCDLSIAINERRGTQTKTTYAQVTVWRAQAENCARYLSKGKKIAAWGAVAAVRAGAGGFADGKDHSHAQCLPLGGKVPQCAHWGG